jgi:tetrahydromethanopterin S-methyltransferase subunit F
MGGNAAASASGYQAQVARINAQVALTNRDQTLTAGARKAEASGIAARQTAGRIVTAQAGSGLNLNSDSFQRVRASQGAAASKDIATIYDNTAR